MPCKSALSRRRADSNRCLKLKRSYLYGLRCDWCESDSKPVTEDEKYGAICVDCLPKPKPQQLPVERPPRPEAWIYFIQADDFGPVKIGIARTPTDRLVFFQTGNHHELHLRLMIRGTVDDEQAIHRSIQPHLRIRNEWFDASVLDAAICFEQIVTRARGAA